MMQTFHHKNKPAMSTIKRIYKDYEIQMIGSVNKH